VLLENLRTPKVLIEQSRVIANIERLQAAVTARGLRLRPHAKTHKSTRVARWQLDRGAVGICCAKLDEAKVFAENGIENIRLPYPLNPSNAPLLLTLQDQSRISFIVDHLGVAQQWSELMQRHRRIAEVLIKVDVGFHRCGIDPNAPRVLDFIKSVNDLPGLKLLGLLSHAGHGYNAKSELEMESIARAESRILSSLAKIAHSNGIAISEISVGATPTLRYSLNEESITELRPGNYVYCDRTQVGLGSASLDDCALTVLATIVSKPSENRIILDCGSKTLSSDTARGMGDPKGYGLVFTDLAGTKPNYSWIVERLSEEHAVVQLESKSTKLEPGDKVRIIPNHSCVVSNLVNEVCLVDGEKVIGTMRVEARGTTS
jgi:D-serine deaminase-like pyridoxal phosphate-dependent protein